MKSHSSAKCLAALLMTVFLNSCVMYTGFDPDASVPERKVDTKIKYRVGKSPFSGDDAIVDKLKSNEYFTDTVRVSEKPNSGTFVDVKIGANPPSMGAMIWGYVAFSTSFIFPTWSTRDGNELIYEIYQDGEVVKSFDYDVNRKSFIWLGALPFIWVNFLTPGEADAFIATTNQFYLDSKETFDDIAKTNP